MSVVDEAPEKPSPEGETPRPARRRDSDNSSGGTALFVGMMAFVVLLVGVGGRDRLDRSADRRR